MEDSKPVRVWNSNKLKIIDDPYLLFDEQGPAILLEWCKFSGVPCLVYSSRCNHQKDGFFAIVKSKQAGLDILFTKPPI